VVFPDVMGGMKRADELGANISPEGDVLEGQWQAAPTPASMPSQPSAIEAHNQALTLDDLVLRFSAEAVLVANEGKIPGTIEELEAVEKKLVQAGAA
jgi:hypothetical protein